MDNGASSYRRFLDGDDDGIVEIIRDYKDGLVLYLNNYVQNIHTAEDLMEDTFVRIAVKRPKFAGKSSFKTWLYAIGRNIAVDHIRKHARLSVVSTEDVMFMLSDEENAERAYLRDERKLTVHRALKQLNPKYRTILHLIFFEELSVKEAATVMDLSQKQAENLIYRAKMSLRSELEKEGFTYEEL